MEDSPGTMSARPASPFRGAEKRWVLVALVTFALLVIGDPLVKVTVGIAAIAAGLVLRRQGDPRLKPLAAALAIGGVTLLIVTVFLGFTLLAVDSGFSSRETEFPDPRIEQPQNLP